MPISRWDHLREVVTSNLILTHLSLVLSAVLYLSTVLFWACLGWLIYDNDYVISVFRTRLIESKLATILALSLVMVYPVYFWHHFKRKIVEFCGLLKGSSDSYLSVRLGLGKNPADFVLKRTIELNATLTDNLLEEGRALRSDMQRCLDMVETSLNRDKEKKPPRCPICLTPYDDDASILHVFDCGHHVCQNDIANCTRGGVITCPMCRSESFQPPIRLYI